MMDLIAALVLSATHPAPKYIEPVRTIPLVVQAAPTHHVPLEVIPWGRCR